MSGSAARVEIESEAGRKGVFMAEA
jgi:hypothetical protein